MGKLLCSTCMAFALALYSWIKVNKHRNVGCTKAGMLPVAYHCVCTWYTCVTQCVIRYLWQVQHTHIKCKCSFNCEQLYWHLLTTISLYRHVHVQCCIWAVYILPYTNALVNRLFCLDTPSRFIVYNTFFTPYRAILQYSTILHYTYYTTQGILLCKN